MTTSVSVGQTPVDTHSAPVTWSRFPVAGATVPTVPPPAATTPTPPPLTPASSARPQPTNNRIVQVQKAGDDKPMDGLKIPAIPGVGEQTKRMVEDKKEPEKEAPKMPSTTTVARPDPEKVFRIESDSSLDQRIGDELFKDALDRFRADPKSKPENEPKRDRFAVPASNFQEQGQYVAKTGQYQPRQLLLEPGYVVHRRLFFEEKNSERYGWDLGLVSPIVSTAYFYKDVLLLPAHLASNFCERFDTNAGKYMPGTPLPYSLYPPEVTIPGGIFGAGVITAIALFLP